MTYLLKVFEFARSLCKSIPRNVEELIDADAAADEQLAFRLMKAAGGMFSNAKVKARDPTHAFRRRVRSKYVLATAGM